MRLRGPMNWRTEWHLNVVLIVCAWIIILSVLNLILDVAFWVLS